MSQDLERKAENQTPTEIMALLGPPPLLSGESGELYSQLFTRVAELLNAGNDIILLILTKRFTDGTWEASRYGRQRAVSIDRQVRRSVEFQAERRKKQKERREAALAKIADRLGQPKDEFASMIEREALIESTVEDVDEILLRTPTELEHNRALEGTILLQGQFDVLINSATRRQDDSLDVAERYQAMKQRRSPPKEIIEGEYQEIESATN